MLVHIPFIDIGGNIGKQRAANLISLPVKDHKIDHHVVFKQKIADGIHRSLERLILGIAVNAGGNERKRQRFAAVFLCQRKRRPVAGNQQFLLSALPAMPARPHRVNDVFAGQSIALCDLCAACFAPMQRFALRQQLRACGAVNAAIHPSAAQQRFIGGVDNGVHLHPGNIVSDDLQRHKALSTFLSV